MWEKRMLYIKRKIYKKKKHYIITIKNKK